IVAITLKQLDGVIQKRGSSGSTVAGNDKLSVRIFSLHLNTGQCPVTDCCIFQIPLRSAEFLDQTASKEDTRRREVTDYIIFGVPFADKIRHYVLIPDF